MSKNALIVFSGGQDSTTCLAQALNDHPNGVEAVAFDYGQRHKIELTQARKIAQLANIPLKIIEIDLFKTLTKNALTTPNLPIETPKNQLPTTFVPGRNHIFLSIAAIIAVQKNIPHIYTGVCQSDYSGYPDCREDFIKSLENTLNLAMDSKLTLHTPLMWLTKAQSIQKMQTLDKLDWYAHTHTCYEGKRPACSQCPACKLRLKGFQEAGIPDPLAYK